jgi:FKBP-type peptidyl-prolyl cis-trans isomerase FklB
MPKGSKWKLYIPSELGYGDRGAGQDIPGGAVLIFDVELIVVYPNETFLWRKPCYIGGSP